MSPGLRGRGFFVDAAPEGAIHRRKVTVCLKAYPDTNLRALSEFGGCSHPAFVCQTRMIITSVALIKAAAVCPFFSFISRTAPEVIREVMSCPPTDRVTWAYQAADADIDDAADKLIAATDALVGDAAFAFVAAARAIEQSIHLSLRNAVMSAGRLYAAQFVAVDPLFDRGIADL